MKKLCYIAGPISSSGETSRNIHKAIRVANKLWEKGFTPYVPHLSVFWNSITPRDREFWMEYDKSILIRCDCMLRLKGYSKGADEEVEFCHENDISVYRTIGELVVREDPNLKGIKEKIERSNL